MCAEQKEMAVVDIGQTCPTIAETSDELDSERRNLSSI